MNLVKLSQAVCKIIHVHKLILCVTDRRTHWTLTQCLRRFARRQSIKPSLYRSVIANITHLKPKKCGLIGDITRWGVSIYINLHHRLSIKFNVPLDAKQIISETSRLPSAACDCHHSSQKMNAYEGLMMLSIKKIRSILTKTRFALRIRTHYSRRENIFAIGWAFNSVVGVARIFSERVHFLPKKLITFF